MSNNTPVTTNTLDYALHLIKLLPDALLHATRSLSDTQRWIADLDGRTCTGNVHWRDKVNSSKTPKLYILHSTNQACPIHGKPSQGERLRVYIGNKPDKIADALAAIERAAELGDLQRDHHRLQAMLTRTVYTLKNIYLFLGYPVPDPEPDVSPTATENGQMETE